VVARDSYGAETEGPVWSFTTGIFPYIESVPDLATADELVTISGLRFYCGTPEWVRVGGVYLYRTNLNMIKSWTTTKIVFRMPSLVNWPPGGSGTLPVQIKAGGRTSNVMMLIVCKP